MERVKSVLRRIDLDNKVELLFVVDIRFYEQKTTPKQYMYNEI